MLKATISIVLLIVVFQFVPIDGVIEALVTAHIGYALAGIAVTPILFYMGAVQTKILADHQTLTLTVGQIFRINFVTQFYGLFLPGIIAGGAIRWYKFTRQDGKPAQALTTIAFGRLANMLVAVFIGLICWFLDATARNNTAFGGGLVLVLCGTIVAFWLFLHPELSSRIAATIDARTSLPHRWRRAAVRVLNSVADFRALGTGRLLIVAGINGLIHVLGILSFALLAVAVSVDVSVISIAWIRTYLLLIAILPISFSGLGVREGGLIVMLAAYGVPPEIAVAYSFLIFSRHLFSAAVGGVLELWGFSATRFLPRT